MNTRAFRITVGSLFTLILSIHILRIIYGWPIFIADVEIKMWGSWLAVVVLGALVIWAFGQHYRR